jgi:hypothetical protein
VGRAASWSAQRLLAGALVPPALAAAGVADGPAGGADLGWDLVAGGKGGVGLAGVIGGEEQRLAQAGVALLGRTTGGVGEA